MSQQQEEKIDNIREHASIVNHSFVNENIVSNNTVNHENSENYFINNNQHANGSSNVNSNERIYDESEIMVCEDSTVSAIKNESSSIVKTGLMSSFSGNVDNSSVITSGLVSSVTDSNRKELKRKNSWVAKNTENDMENRSCLTNFDNKNKEVSRRSGESIALNLLLSYGDTSSENEGDDDDNGDGVVVGDDVGSGHKITDVDVIDDNIESNKDHDGPNTSSNRISNNACRSFGDMSLTFPRSQQFIDDDALSLTSSSPLSSCSSIIFSGSSDLSDAEFDDELVKLNEESDRNADVSNTKNDVACVPKRMKKIPDTKNKNKLPLTEGELAIDDLPAIEDLHISVPKDQCVLLGNIFNIVDKLVVVQALKDIPALNLDTVLFLEWDKPLGKVFDVFGPVVEPLYCVRFNSNEHIQMKDIKAGMPVYFVPQSNHTKYVFLSQLLKMKGSDASWENNNEPPLEYLEYSDDEQERNAKKYLKKIGRRKKGSDKPPDDHQLTAYERHMNKRNLRKSKRQKQEPQVKKPWKQHSQLIQPPSFLPPSLLCCGSQTNSTTPELTSLDNRTPFDVKPSIIPNAPQTNNFNLQPHRQFASYNHNTQGIPSVSSNLRDYSTCGGQPSHSQSGILIPNRPPPSAPWSFTSMTSNTNSGNIFSSPRTSFSSDIFSSPPPLQRITDTPPSFHHSTAATTHPSQSMFSSPFPNFPQNNFKYHADLNRPPRSDNNFPRPFLPFSENSGNDVPNFNPFSIPPPIASNGMFSVPPPTIPYNSSSDRSLQSFPNSHSTVNYRPPDSVSHSYNPSNNFHSSFPSMGNRLP